MSDSTVDVPFQSEFDDPRSASMAANMAAAGEQPYQKVQADYFGFEETQRIPLPDGISYIEHKVLNEGQRRKYLNKVNRDVKFQKGTGDAIMRTAPGDEKHALLSVAIVGWNLQRNGQPIAFTTANLEKFLDSANPRLVDTIEKEIKKANPWLLAEMTVEDIEREIADLQVMLEQRREEEAGKATS